MLEDSKFERVVTFDKPGNVGLVYFAFSLILIYLTIYCFLRDSLDSLVILFLGIAIGSYFIVFINNFPSGRRVYWRKMK